MATTMTSGTVVAVAMATLLAAAHSDPPQVVGAPHMTMATESFVPLPRPRPGDGEDNAAADVAARDISAPLPQPKPERSARSAVAEEAGLPRLMPDEHAACMSGLHQAGIAAEVLPPIHEEPCGMRWPLRLAAIGQDGEAIDLSPPARVRCPVAKALAQWVETAVQPVAQAHLGARVTGLRVAGSYVCRARNHAPGARLSEHAIGNAIDIAAFRIGSDDWLAVGPREDEDAPDAQFLSDVRNAACTYFHTVLGPGSDAYHTDHFHLDLARRGKSGTGRYCR